MLHCKNSNFIFFLFLFFTTKKTGHSKNNKNKSHFFHLPRYNSLKTYLGIILKRIYDHLLMLFLRERIKCVVEVGSILLFNHTKKLKFKIATQLLDISGYFIFTKLLISFLWSRVISFIVFLNKLFNYKKYINKVSIN